MSNTQKHIIDVFTFLTALAAWLDVFTKIIGFLVAIAGLIWWGLRFYNEYWKGNKHGD